MLRAISQIALSLTLLAITQWLIFVIARLRKKSWRDLREHLHPL
ncbi:hypothetical protein [Helicobacter sp.]|nr:hypothetical protein [Helicobacter sp.]